MGKSSLLALRLTLKLAVEVCLTSFWKRFKNATLEAKGVFTLTKG